jgi:uncharacterized protein (DUF2236 family)
VRPDPPVRFPTCDTTTADPGFFGPGSVSWRVNAEPVALIGGLRALLLQALHPVVLHGVLIHSDFRGDPWGRLARTAEHVGRTTFGTTSEAQEQNAVIRSVHARLPGGTEPRSGRRYRLDDQDLLLWVHVTEMSSFLDVARLAGLRLTRAERDAYHAEQVTAARLIGIDPALVPTSEAAAATYLRSQRAQLRVDRTTLDVARTILVPPMPPMSWRLPAQLGWAGVAGLAAGSLPRWARRLYRLPGLPTTDLAVAVQLRLLRQAVGVLGSRLGDGPHLSAALTRLGLTREDALRPLAA